MELKYTDFQVLYNSGLDIKERTFYLIGEIDIGCVDSLVQSIAYLNSKKHCPDSFKDPIKLVINSPGGVDDMMVFAYDSLVASNAEIHTIGSGMVCSAATLLLVAGDKRFATENCLFMTHKGTTTISGNEDEIQSGAEVHKKVSQTYWRLLERHTKLTANKWISLSKKKGELWIDAKNMLEFGVIDEILKPARRTFQPLSVRKINV